MASLFAATSLGIVVASLVPGTGPGLLHVFIVPFGAAFATFGSGVLLNRARLQEIFPPAGRRGAATHEWSPWREGPRWLRATIGSAAVLTLACFVWTIATVPPGNTTFDGGVIRWGGTVISSTVYDARTRAIARLFAVWALYFHVLAVALVVAGPARRSRRSSDLPLGTVPPVDVRADEPSRGRRLRSLALAIVTGVVVVFSALMVIGGAATAIEDRPLRVVATQLEHDGQRTTLDDVQPHRSSPDQDPDGATGTFTVDGHVVHAELAGASQDSLAPTTVVYDPANPTTAMLADDVTYYAHDDLTDSLGFIGIGLVPLVVVVGVRVAARARRRSRLLAEAPA